MAAERAAEDRGCLLHLCWLPQCRGLSCKLAVQVDEISRKISVLSAFVKSDEDAEE